MTDDPLLPIAEDLTAIQALERDLEDQATHIPGGRTQMPGGDLMNLLGNPGSIEAWQHRLDTTERAHYATCGRTSHRRCHIADHVEDQVTDELIDLLVWTEAWRVEHNREMDAPPTLGTEAAFLRQILPWAYRHEPRFADLADDVHTVRRSLEDKLRAGDRAQRTTVPCDQAGCEDRPRLVKHHGATVADDRYVCPACRHRYDDDAYKRAYAAQLRTEAGDRWVRKTDATSVLRELGRPERTIRKWFELGMVPTVRDAAARLWVWWPDLWRLHLGTATRRRAA